jgi:hypothetical protein
MAKTMMYTYRYSDSDIFVYSLDQKVNYGTEEGDLIEYHISIGYDSKDRLVRKIAIVSKELFQCSTLPFSVYICEQSVDVSYDLDYMSFESEFNKDQNGTRFHRFRSAVNAIRDYLIDDLLDLGNPTDETKAVYDFILSTEKEYREWLTR